jgi:hypothetical protein
MAHTYRGEMKNGVVVFEEGAPHPPEGLKVPVEPAWSPLRPLRLTIRRGCWSLSPNSNACPAPQIGPRTGQPSTTVL